MANKINNKEVKIRNKEVAETPQNQFFRGKKIREFVSPLNPPKGEVFILDIKIIIVFLSTLCGGGKSLSSWSL